MVYRVCKSFEVESGHMLSKHPGLCRFPHGHTRRVEVVLASDALDAQDMVCDFKAVKLAVGAFIDQLDHAMAMNSADPMVGAMCVPGRVPTRDGEPGAAGAAGAAQRLVLFENQDPTTEVLARWVFDHLAGEVRAGREYRDQRGQVFRFPPGLRVERVRVSETSSTWAEYGL
jgi:6-pyruvoyltetrahydropterin/6-carboxytetrahydropterin synthase